MEFNQLKKCPFCNGKPKMLLDNEVIKVVCEQCGAGIAEPIIRFGEEVRYIDVQFTENVVTSKWNERAYLDEENYERMRNQLNSLAKAMSEKSEV